MARSCFTRRRCAKRLRFTSPVSNRWRSSRRSSMRRCVHRACRVERSRSASRLFRVGPTSCLPTLLTVRPQCSRQRELRSTRFVRGCTRRFALHPLCPSNRARPCRDRGWFDDGLRAGSVTRRLAGGSVYINLKDTSEWPKFTLPTLTFHEAVPGHQWQSAFARSRGEMPLLRVLSGRFAAYTEGWGVYAEQLADELGMYDEDPLDGSGCCSPCCIAPCVWSWIQGCTASAGAARALPTISSPLRLCRAVGCSARSTGLCVARTGLQLQDRTPRVAETARSDRGESRRSIRCRQIPRGAAGGTDASCDSRAGAATGMGHRAMSRVRLSVVVASTAVIGLVATIVLVFRAGPLYSLMARDWALCSRTGSRGPRSAAL